MNTEPQEVAGGGTVRLIRNLDDARKLLQATTSLYPHHISKTSEHRIVGHYDLLADAHQAWLRVAVAVWQTNPPPEIELGIKFMSDVGQWLVSVEIWD